MPELTKSSVWVEIEDFRGEPGTEPLCWWWLDGAVDADRALIDPDGTIGGKHTCGLRWCTHVMLMDPAIIPAPPAQGAGHAR